MNNDSNSTRKLLSIASSGLMPCLDVDCARSFLRGFGEPALELCQLLAERNGFYAFEAALHVFPLGSSIELMDLRAWNAPDLWKRAYDVPLDRTLFFAEDLFGGQFGIENDRIVRFDPETGESTEFATNFDTWAGRIIQDYEVETGFPLAHAWQIKSGPLPRGQRLVPVTPFVCRGAFEIENLHALDSVQGMLLRANLARQIRDLPDGAQIEYRVTDD